MPKMELISSRCFLSNFITLFLMGLHCTELTLFRHRDRGKKEKDIMTMKLLPVQCDPECNLGCRRDKAGTLPGEPSCWPTCHHIVRDCVLTHLIPFFYSLVPKEEYMFDLNGRR